MNLTADVWMIIVIAVAAVLATGAAAISMCIVGDDYDSGIDD